MNLSQIVTTSAIIKRLQNDIDRVNAIRDRIYVELEEHDARIEELQANYKDLAADLMANYMVQFFNARLSAHPVVVEKCETLCRLAESVYRLVK